MAAGETPLHHPFAFSYMRRGKAAKTEASEGSAAANTNANENVPVHPYETSIKSISQVSTVEEFWNVYNFLKRPNDLPTTTDYHFFRQNIKPTWEDPGNEKGGKWIIRLPKGLASRYWEEIVLALAGCQFQNVPVDELCGAVLSVRYSEDILGVWNRNASDHVMVERIRDAIKKILHLPNHANMEYKPHQASLQDRSSFRNTQVWKPTARRSGSWTERDKTKRGETRGSWRSNGSNH